MSHSFVPFKFYTISILLKFIYFFFLRKEFTDPCVMRILHLPMNLGGSFSFSFCNDVKERNKSRNVHSNFLFPCSDAGVLLAESCCVHAVALAYALGLH